VILAHGALGPFDELLMLSAAAIFLVMMAISWVRSRNIRPKEDTQRDQDEPDRFTLD
jgi:hypothetical protein